MPNLKQGFTLIELIIVVVIVAILAVVAIPRYFANIDKAKKSQVYYNLDLIRQAMLAHYAAYGIYPSVFPITVTVEGEAVVNLADPDPSYTSWHYYVGQPDCNPRGAGATYAYKQPGNSCYYLLCTDGHTTGTCTP